MTPLISENTQFVSTLHIHSSSLSVLRQFLRRPLLKRFVATHRHCNTRGVSCVLVRVCVCVSSFLSFPFFPSSSLGGFLGHSNSSEQRLTRARSQTKVCVCVCLATPSVQAWVLRPEEHAQTWLAVCCRNHLE